MKKNKTLITLLGVLLALQCLAQERTRFPDSIRVKTEYGGTIDFAFYEISSKQNYIDNELWKSMVNIMESAVLDSDIEGGKRVSYESKKVEEEDQVYVKVSPLPDPSDVLIIDKNGTQRLKGNRTSFEIYMPKIRVFFSVNNSEQLRAVRDLDVESVWQEIANKYSDEGNRNYYVGKGTLKYDQVSIDNIEAESGALEQLELSLIGVGLGYYRDRFVPDFNSKLGVHLYDRFGDSFMELGFTYNLQFFFTRQESGKFDQDLNGWLNGFAKFKPGDKNEVGVGIGSLIHRDGNFYSGDTWKLSVYSKPGESKLSYGTELVFTDNFKTFFPALRFGFTF